MLAFPDFEILFPICYVYQLIYYPSGIPHCSSPYVTGICDRQFLNLQSTCASLDAIKRRCTPGEIENFNDGLEYKYVRENDFWIEFAQNPKLLAT
jgi:hypothetical protein